MKISRRLPKPLVALSLIGVLGLGISPAGRRTTLGFRTSMQNAIIGAGDWMAWGSTSDEPLLLDQFREDLALALSFNQSTNNLQEWHRTGYLPSDVIHSVREMARIEKRTEVKPRAAKKFCRAIQELSDADLTLFHVAIEDSGSLLPCREALLGRISTFWEAKKATVAKVDLDSISQNTRESEVRVDTGVGQAVGESDIPAGHWVLSFSDGPHPSRTDRILLTLAAGNWPSNFFFTGERTQRLAGIVRSAADLGHVIGSQGYRPESLMHMTLKEASRSIGRGIQQVGSQVGVQPHLFRFPFGLATPSLHDFVAEHGMRTMDWTLDSLDWKIRDPNELREHLVGEMLKRDRGVVILHDTLEQTALALPGILADLRKHGIQPAVVVPNTRSEIAKY